MTGQRPETTASAVVSVEARRVMALSHVARARGLAQSLEFPLAPLDPGTRAVAGEINLLLESVRDFLVDTQDSASAGLQDPAVVDEAGLG